MNNRLALFRKILKYEVLNILRSRWVLVYSALWLLLGSGLIQITGDFKKSLVALTTIAVILCPLASVLFTVVSWYYSERFTLLLLTQPVPRPQVYFARTISLVALLFLGFFVPVTLSFLVRGFFSADLLLLIMMAGFLTAVFVSIGMLVGLFISDRVKGVGVALGLWLYFAIIHDALLLLILAFLRDYPMDLAAGFLASLNPIGFARMSLLLYYDVALLLGHAGALVRSYLTGPMAVFAAVLIAFCWITIPSIIGLKKFKRRDF